LSTLSCVIVLCYVCFTSSHHFGAVIEQLLATGSKDRTVKLWDLSNNEPSCIATHNPNAVRTNNRPFKKNKIGFVILT